MLQVINAHSVTAWLEPLPTCQADLVSRQLRALALYESMSKLRLVAMVADADALGSAIAAAQLAGALVRGGVGDGLMAAQQMCSTSRQVVQV